MDEIKNKINSTKLSIIIPVYNEKNTIKDILDKIENQIYIKKEIIIVDDNSQDGTSDIINKYKFFSEHKILKHNKNLGKGASIKTASNHITGDIVLIQDADLEYDPSDYLNLVKPIINQETKIVYGSRLLKHKNETEKNIFVSDFRVLANSFLTIFSNFLNNQKLTDAHTCYKVFEKNLFLSLNLQEDGFAFCPEVTTKVSRKNQQILEIPINYFGRSHKDGKKIGFYDGIEAILAIIKYRFF